MANEPCEGCNFIDTIVRSKDAQFKVSPVLGNIEITRRCMHGYVVNGVECGRNILAVIEHRDCLCGQNELPNLHIIFGREVQNAAIYPNALAAIECSGGYLAIRSCAECWDPRKYARIVLCCVQLSGRKITGHGRNEAIEAPAGIIFGEIHVTGRGVNECCFVIKRTKQRADNALPRCERIAFKNLAR
jgi:hypothetical protein